MRRLVLLALVALAAFPLSAHGRWRRPRRVVVLEPAPVYRSWDEDRWVCRDRAYGLRDRYDDDDFDRPRVVVRPLPPPRVAPFQARVEFWLR